MECIFLEAGTDCTAHLPQFASGSKWKPDDKTMREFCVSNFAICPRLKAYIEYKRKT